MINVNPIPGPFPNNFAHINPNAKKGHQMPAEANLPRYHHYIADTGGCGMYRVLWPEYVINATQLGISHSNTAMVLDPNWYRGCKVVQIQRQAADSHKEFVQFLKQIQPEMGFRLVYNIDDVVFPEDIPDYNKFKFAFDDAKIRQNCVDIMHMCDEIVVTCPFMRDLYRERLGKREVTVIPNFPPHFWIGNLYDRKKIYDNLDKYKRKPRILYAGSGAHFDVDNKAGQKDDFEHVIKAIVDTRHKYQWVFMGAVPRGLEQYVASGEIELHPWEQILTYPNKIAALNVNLAIAPLQDNNFNKSKSDIKIVEASLLGIPCLVQNICTYGTAPEYMKFDNDNFLDKIEELLNYKNKARYYKKSDDLKRHYQDRVLELPQNIGCWVELFNTPYGSSERKLLSKWNDSI